MSKTFFFPQNFPGSSLYTTVYLLPFERGCAADSGAAPFHCFPSTSSFESLHSIVAVNIDVIYFSLLEPKDPRWHSDRLWRAVLTCVALRRIDRTRNSQKSLTMPCRCWYFSSLNFSEFFGFLTIRMSVFLHKMIDNLLSDGSSHGKRPSTAVSSPAAPLPLPEAIEGHRFSQHWLVFTSTALRWLVLF